MSTRAPEGHPPLPELSRPPGVETVSLRQSGRQWAARVRDAAGRETQCLAATPAEARERAAQRLEERAAQPLPLTRAVFAWWPKWRHGSDRERAHLRTLLAPVAVAALERFAANLTSLGPGGLLTPRGADLQVRAGAVEALFAGLTVREGDAARLLPDLVRALETPLYQEYVIETALRSFLQQTRKLEMNETAADHPALSPVELAVWTEMQRRGYALADPVYAEQKRELAEAAGSTSAGVSVALAGIRKKLGVSMPGAPGSVTPSQNGKNGHHATSPAAPHQDRARDAPEAREIPSGPGDGTTAGEPETPPGVVPLEEPATPRLLEPAAQLAELESQARIAIGERDHWQAEYRRLETALRETQQALDASEERREALEAGELLPVPAAADLPPDLRARVITASAQIARKQPGLLDVEGVSVRDRCRVLARALYLVRRELCLDDAAS